MSDDHIITAVTGYAPHVLAPFFRSLIDIKYRGRVHLLTLPEDSDPRRWNAIAAPLQVVTHPIKRSRSLVCNRIFRLLQLMPIPAPPGCEGTAFTRLVRYCLQKSLPISSYRYISALCIVRSLAPSAAVLLTDARDVYFQSDPFDSYRHLSWGRLSLSLESKAITINNITYSWMRDMYGAEEANRFIGRPVSCSGTTIADRESMLHYLHQMVYHLIRHRSKISHTVGYDQGVHNYLFHGGLLADAEAPANGAGLFFVAQERPTFCPDGNVVNNAGEIIPVVHQYDRAIKHFQSSRRFRELCKEALS